MIYRVLKYIIHDCQGCSSDMHLELFYLNMINWAAGFDPGSAPEEGALKEGTFARIVVVPSTLLNQTDCTLDAGDA